MIYQYRIEIKGRRNKHCRKLKDYTFSKEIRKLSSFFLNLKKKGLEKWQVVDQMFDNDFLFRMQNKSLTNLTF